MKKIILMTIDGEPDAFKDVDSLKEYFEELGWEDKTTINLLNKAKNRSSFVHEGHNITVYMEYVVS